MICYECCKLGETRDAVGLCHHCSAALCLNHARVVDDPVTASFPVSKTVVLPKHARLMLCDTCMSALHQSHNHALALAEK